MCKLTRHKSENVEELIKRLRIGAKECNYWEHDRQVKEQFIYGINDKNMQIEINSEHAKMNHISAVYRGSRQAVHKLEEFGDSQINMLNTYIIYSHTKSSDIIAKLNTNNLHNRINISHKIDKGSNSNMLPFHIFKILFLKSAKKLLL